MPVMSITLLILAVVLMLLGTSIAVSLGLSAILVMLIYQPVPNMMIIPQMFSEASTSFVLLAVPLFILAGNLMERGTMGRNLIDFTTSLVGWAKGGLGAATITGSMIFGGISGSSLADTATFGTIMVPRMMKDGYPKDYAAAITLTSSCLAVIIPPSILIVLAAASTLQSVGKALAGGILPGILITALLFVPNYVISKNRGFGTRIPFSLKNVFSKFITCWTALIAPLIILGSIFSGVVTPTEGALVAVGYILFVDMLIFKRLSWADLVDASKSTAVLTSAILFIATSSAMANWIIAYENVPKYGGSVGRRARRYRRLPDPDQHLPADHRHDAGCRAGNDHLYALVPAGGGQHGDRPDAFPDHHGVRFRTWIGHASIRGVSVQHFVDMQYSDG